MDWLMKKTRPNACPICGGPLHLSEIERNKYNLSINGEKESFEEEFYDLRIVCDSCKTEFDAIKRGMHYSIRKQLPEVKMEIKGYNPFQIS